jgi:hypothetical protein
MILRVAQDNQDARSSVDGAFNSKFFVPNIIEQDDFQITLTDTGGSYTGTFLYAHNLGFVPNAYVVVKPTGTTRIPLQVSQGSSSYDYLTGTAYCNATDLTVDLQKDLFLSSGTLVIDGYFYLIKP